MENEKRKGFQFRAFTSTVITISFLIISISGIILYIVPPGRIAHWTHWKLFALQKDDWAAVHTIFSYVFIAFAIVHIVYNYKTLLAYLKDRVTKSFSFRAEWILAAALSLVIWIATVFGIAPFSTIMDIGETFKNSWGKSEALPHTEAFTLKKFSSVYNVKLETMKAKLKTKGIDNVSNEMTLDEIANKYKTTPKALYDIIMEDEEKTESKEYSHSSNEEGSYEGTGSGHGYGKLKIKDAAEKAGISYEEAVNRLKKKGIIYASEEKTLRTLAEDNNIAPSSVYQAIAGE